MSSSLIKVMGWGFNDLQLDANQGHIEDPRINSGALQRLAEKHIPLKGYFEWLKITYSQDDPKLEHGRQVKLMDTDLMMLNFAKEMGREQVQESEVSEYLITKPGVDSKGCSTGTLIIIPVFMGKEWVHMDDAIDYAEKLEDDLEGKPQEGTVELKYSQFPYSDYMNKETGESISFEDYKLGNKNAGLAVPLPVKHFTDWLELFGTPKTYLGLKPLIFTYWS